MKRHLTALLALVTGLLALPAPAYAGAAGDTAAGTTPPPAQVLSPTPYMGWNTYYALGGDSTEAEVKSVADSLVSSGLRGRRLHIVWIDGGWAAPTPRSVGR